MNLEAKKKGCGSIMWRVAAVVAALGVLAFTILEVDSIRNSITNARFESNCNDYKVDIEACGQFGIRQFREPGSAEEMLAGRTLLKKMCDDGQPVACRQIAYSGQSWAVEFVSYRDWSDELTTRCMNDGGTACLARAYIRGEDSSPDFSEDLIKKMGAHCNNGDLDACAGWVALRPRSVPTEPACKAGLTGACAGEHVFYPASAANREHTGKLAEAQNSQSKCNSGDAAACDAWGTELVVQNMREWRAAPLDSTVLEETFGTACRSGDSHACIRGANAAVDRQIGESKDTKLADEYLTIGCSLGNVQACWFRLSVQSLPLDESREIAKKACYASPPEVFAPACQTYAAIWMADSGYTPWIMDTALNAPVMKDTCSKFKDTYACGRLARNAYVENDRAFPAMFPNRVEAWSAAELACGRQDDLSCGILIQISKDWPTETTQSVEELADSICTKLPNMCSMVRVAMEETPR